MSDYDAFVCFALAINCCKNIVYSDITELNAEIIRTFVEKIIVYEAEKNDGIKTQRVKIVYNCVGTVSVPNIDNEPVKTDKTKIIEVA